MTAPLGAAGALASSFTWAYASTRYAAASRTLGVARLNLIRALTVLPIYLVAVIATSGTTPLAGLTAHHAGWLAASVLCSYGFGDAVFFVAARRLEVVDITPEDLKLIRIHPSGRREEITLNPYWVRPHLAEREDGANRLYLRSHGRHYAVGSFLTDDERRDLADALSRALADVRAG